MAHLKLLKAKEKTEKAVLEKNRYRFEYKYLLTKCQKELLKVKNGDLLGIDKNAVEHGGYNIRSIYLDDYKNTSLKQVINGISDREKYRIRFYNCDSSYIALEKKKKTNNMTIKTSCRITKEQLENIIHNEDLVISKENPKLLNELYLKMKTQRYKPVCIVEYDRIPYIYNSGNVRITLDYNISVSYDFENAFSQNLAVIPIMNRDRALLEVKFNDFIPDFIRWRLQLNTLSRTSYSKYAKGRLMLNSVIKNNV